VVGAQSSLLIVTIPELRARDVIVASEACCYSWRKEQKIAAGLTKRLTNSPHLPE
jgi:hypothetical protein